MHRLDLNKRKAIVEQVNGVQSCLTDSIEDPNESINIPFKRRKPWILI